MRHIRKTLLVRDIVTSEMGHMAEHPTVRAVALAVLANPFASRYVEDGLPIKNIEVKSSQTKSGPYKSATWRYPYKRLADEYRGDFFQWPITFFCKDGIRRMEGELYLKARTSITNGKQTKELFDCRRGLVGEFDTIPNEPSGPDRFWPPDPAKVDMNVVRPHSNGDVVYQGICLRVMHEKPYSPE